MGDEPTLTRSKGHVQGPSHPACDVRLHLENVGEGRIKGLLPLRRPVGPVDQLWSYPHTPLASYTLLPLHVTHQEVLHTQLLCDLPWRLGVCRYWLELVEAMTVSVGRVWPACPGSRTRSPQQSRLHSCLPSSRTGARRAAWGRLRRPRPRRFGSYVARERPQVHPTPQPQGQPGAPPAPSSGPEAVGSGPGQARGSRRRRHSGWKRRARPTLAQTPPRWQTDPREPARVPL